MGLTMLLPSSTLLPLPNQLLQSPTPMMLLQLLLPPLLLPLILPTLMLLLMPMLLSTPDVSTALDLLSLAHKPKTSIQDLYISTETKDYNYQKNCQQQNRIRRPKTASLTVQIVYFRRSEAHQFLLSISQFVKKTLV